MFIQQQLVLIALAMGLSLQVQAFIILSPVIIMVDDLQIIQRILVPPLMVH